VRTLLASIHAGLPPGGTLLVAEPMSGAAGAAPIGDAYFGFYLLAMGRGRARTFSEISALLIEAGFSAVREIPTRRPLLTSMIIACRV
jgi:demethylspheroidene O-methyltransferase